MSYIPDYRKETSKLNEVDRAGIAGYRMAVDDIKSFFDDLEDENALSIEREITERLKARLEERMECDEKEFVCSLFDNADYLPDNIELVDSKANES